MAFRRTTLILTLAGALAFGFAADAFARAGGGSSFGSRGGRTFSAPPPTQTAPRGAAPMERSMTQPGQSNFGTAAAQRQRSGLFSGGFGSGLMGGLLGGLLGAGLFGLLFGHGLFGGLGGLSSILGLILQIGLLYLLFRLVMGFIRSRQPAMQGAPGSGQGDRGLFSGLVRPRENGGTGQGGPGFGVFGGGSSPYPGAAPRSRRLDVSPADFEAFEKRLAAVQSAYSAQDLNGLGSLATPEMVSYFAEELDKNARQGLVNRVSDVRFLQGDLSEAWREQNAEFATVAMQFSSIDTMVDRSGKVVAGDPLVPQEATELWTFTRRPGGSTAEWKLSAIQQA